MNTLRVQVGGTFDADREPSAEELRTVPTMTPAERSEIMKSKEYKTSKLVQKLVAASVAKSVHSTPGEKRWDGGEPEPVQSLDEIAAKTETVKALFRNPRYKSDPLYRLEVQQKMAAMTANDGTLDEMPGPGQTVRVSVSGAATRGSDLTVGRFHRVDMPSNITGPDAPVKKQTREPFSEAQ